MQFVPYCNEKHPLQQTVDQERAVVDGVCVNRTCNRCEQEIRPGNSFMSCSHCAFDLCMGCVKHQQLKSLPRTSAGFGVHLRDILKETVFLREVSRQDIEFHRDWPEDGEMKGMFDSRMLSQAFGNLIKNATEAIDAVPDDVERDGKHIHIRAKPSGEEGYLVEIIDNGRGLPTENRHRLLEPYMTMREKGTGLGLAIVKKIIEDHGGSLQLQDAPSDIDSGRGAMISVWLPVRSADPEAEEDKNKETGHGV